MFALVKPASTLAILFALATAALAEDWQIIRINNREYLSVDNVAKFYGLTAGSTPAQRRVRISNTQNSVEFELDSREVMINGVRNWLCFPVAEKDGHYLVSRVD